MAEAFITEEAANFVTAHYEAKSRHLHNAKPWYNTGNLQRRQFNCSLFKGKLRSVGASRNMILDLEEWLNLTLYIFTNLIEVRPYIE